MTFGLSEQIKRKRITRLMRTGGVQGVYRRRSGMPPGSLSAPVTVSAVGNCGTRVALAG